MSESEDTSVSVQFVEIARRHAAQMDSREPMTIWRWCPVCMDRTDHVSTMSGRVETIRCEGCGNTLFEGPTR